MYVSKSSLSTAYIVYFVFMMRQIPGTAICQLRIVLEWCFQRPIHAQPSPLRERQEEIPLLIERITAAQAHKTRQAEPSFSSSCLEAMGRYHWPGNVRELKNLVKNTDLTGCPINPDQ